MAIKNFRCATPSLVSSFYYKAHHGWAEKNYRNRSSHVAGKCYLQVGFANNRAILLIF